MEPKLETARYARMFAALGHEARLLIVRELLAAHPDGLVVGAIQDQLDIAPSTLSHHLDALARHGLVNKRREGTFLRYTAGTECLRELLDFLIAECCSSRIVTAASLARASRRQKP